MIKVYINPDYSGVRPDADNGGIRRVAEAQIEHLPKFGIQVVHNPDQADILCNHGGAALSRVGIPSVAINHGLYWSRYKWGDNYKDVNRQVIDTMAAAVAHTAPSQWVADAIRRGSLWYPEVVYHGVDPDRFTPSNENGNYVLWNKARADQVSDPNDMLRVAQILPGRQFKTTIGIRSENVEILEVVPHDRMKSIVSHAGVYLATARETFGIGTLEAMAYGIPIAGWNWGGQKEIIQQGYTGYLAPPGDYEALAECIEKCFSDRERLSDNCVQDVQERWTWEPRIEQYANIFKRVYDTYCDREGKPKVSVVVTAYNLDKYLPACLNSISNQSLGNFECIVVDDAKSPVTEQIVKECQESDDRIKYFPTPENFGLSGARNYGFSLARGLYIRHMDADDIMLPDTLHLESQALDNESGVHIVYGHLEVVREDGTRILDGRSQNPVRSGWPGEKFDWFQQMAHLNQLPSTVMARRAVYENSGGYRERMKRAEDAEFWCRVTSLGFRAKKFTQAVTMFHRQREDSKGATEWRTEGKEPDWTSWFPWRMGASDYGEGAAKMRALGSNHPNAYLVPFAAQGRPEKLLSWYVHDYSYPVVSVIVTCGPGHRHYLLDALDSIQSQTFPDWECIVVNDTGYAWPSDIMGAPFAKVINMPNNMGVSVARNEGYKHANGKYIVWMDADDYWFPWFLEKMVSYAEKNKNGAIFSDLVKHELVEKKDKFTVYRYPEFECERAAVGMQYPGSSVLYPRHIVQHVMDDQGGFDAVIPGMEDKDFQTAVHAAGYCAYRVPEPLFVYRIYSTTKREKDYNNLDSIAKYMNDKWARYRTGGLKMGCGCGNKYDAQNMPNAILSSSGNFSPESIAASRTPEGQNLMVEIEYVGDHREEFSVRSRVNPQVVYRFANNPESRLRTVYLADAEFLISQIDRFGVPVYRVIAAGATMDQQDPTKFLSAPLETA